MATIARLYSPASMIASRHSCAFSCVLMPRWQTLEAQFHLARPVLRRAFRHVDREGAVARDARGGLAGDPDLIAVRLQERREVAFGAFVVVVVADVVMVDALLEGAAE